MTADITPLERKLAEAEAETKAALAAMARDVGGFNQQAITAGEQLVQRYLNPVASSFGMLTSGAEAASNAMLGTAESASLMGHGFQQLGAAVDGTIFSLNRSLGQMQTQLADTAHLMASEAPTYSHQAELVDTVTHSYLQLAAAMHEVDQARLQLMQAPPQRQLLPGPAKWYAAETGIGTPAQPAISQPYTPVKLGQEFYHEPHNVDVIGGWALQMKQQLGTLTQEAQAMIDHAYRVYGAKTLGTGGLRIQMYKIDQMILDRYGVLEQIDRDTYDLFRRQNDALTEYATAWHEAVARSSRNVAPLFRGSSSFDPFAGHPGRQVTYGPTSPDPLVSFEDFAHGESQFRVFQPYSVTGLQLHERETWARIGREAYAKATLLTYTQARDVIRDSLTGLGLPTGSTGDYPSHHLASVDLSGGTIARQLGLEVAERAKALVAGKSSIAVPGVPGQGGIESITGVGAYKGIPLAKAEEMFNKALGMSPERINDYVAELGDAITNYAMVYEKMATPGKKAALTKKINKLLAEQTIFTKAFDQVIEGAEPLTTLPEQALPDAFVPTAGAWRHPRGFTQGQLVTHLGSGKYLVGGQTASKDLIPLTHPGGGFYGYALPSELGSISPYQSIEPKAQPQVTSGGWMGPFGTEAGTLPPEALQALKGTTLGSAQLARYGSTGALKAIDASGQAWLIKRYRDQDRLASELLSNAIYRIAGLAAPQAGLYQEPEGMALAYPLEAGKHDFTTWTQQMVKELAKGYVMDAFLANWDFIGGTTGEPLHKQNILWQGNQPIRIDQGGTLAYRGFAGRKPFGLDPLADMESMLREGQAGQVGMGQVLSEGMLREQAKRFAEMLFGYSIKDLIQELPFSPGMGQRAFTTLYDRRSALANFGAGATELPPGLRELLQKAPERASSAVFLGTRGPNGIGGLNNPWTVAIEAGQYAGLGARAAALGFTSTPTPESPATGTGADLVAAMNQVRDVAAGPTTINTEGGKPLIVEDPSVARVMALLTSGATPSHVPNWQFGYTPDWIMSPHGAGGGGMPPLLPPTTFHGGGYEPPQLPPGGGPLYRPSRYQLPAPGQTVGGRLYQEPDFTSGGYRGVPPSMALARPAPARIPGMGDITVKIEDVQYAGLITAMMMHFAGGGAGGGPTIIVPGGAGGVPPGGGGPPVAVGPGGAGQGGGGLAALLGFSSLRDLFMGRGRGFGMGGPFGVLPIGAAMGSFGSFAGFDTAHLLMTGLGLAGSAAGGLIGGGLLAGGAAARMGVGMGSDAAVMSSTIADTKTLQTAMQNVQTAQQNVTASQQAYNSALKTYGANAPQTQAALSSYTTALQNAASAHQALNQQVQALGGPTAGVKAEMQLAGQANALNTFWDKQTSQARVAAVHILEQVVSLGHTYVPLVAQAAQQNLSIINTGLKPLFAWLQGPQGVGIFKDLEDQFATQLPTAIHAFDQGAELLIRILDLASQHSGSLVYHLDALFTRWNSLSNAQLDIGVTKFVNIFQMWDKFVKLLVEDIYLLFHQDVGTSAGIITNLTVLLEKIKAYEQSAKGGAQIRNIFELHKTEVLALLHLIESLGGVFSHVYLAIAPSAVAVINNVVLPVVNTIADLLKTIISSSPLAADALGLLFISSRWLGWAKTVGLLTGAFRLLTGAERGSTAVNLAKGLLTGGGGAAAAGAAAKAAAGGGTSALEAGAAGAGGAGLAGIFAKAGGKIDSVATGLASLLEKFGLSGAADAVAGGGGALGSFVASSLTTALPIVLGSAAFIEFLNHVGSPETSAHYRSAATGQVVVNPRVAAFLTPEQRQQIAQGGTGQQTGPNFVKNLQTGTVAISSMNAVAKETVPQLNALLELLKHSSGVTIAGQPQQLNQTVEQIRKVRDTLAILQGKTNEVNASLNHWYADTGRGLGALSDDFRTHMRLINYLLGTNSKQGADEARKNINDFVTAVGKGMADGTIKTKNGTKAIADALKQGVSLGVISAETEWTDMLNVYTNLWEHHRISTKQFLADERTTMVNGFSAIKTDTIAQYQSLFQNLKTQRDHGLISQGQYNADVQGLNQTMLGQERDAYAKYASTTYSAMVDSGKVTLSGSIAIAKQLNELLKPLGATQIPIPSAVVVQQGPGFSASGAPSSSFPGGTHAAGGALVQVGMSGQAGYDSVPMNVGGTSIVVAPGEQVAVFNRHQLPIVNDRLSDMGGLPGLFSTVTTPNYMASGGFVAGGAYAGGGLGGAGRGGNPSTTRSTGVAPAGGHSLPLPSSEMLPGSWSVDQGVDIPVPAGTPEYAIGSGRIIVEGISGFGPNAPVLQLDQPIMGINAVYYGHAGPDTVPLGTHVTGGQRISEVGAGIVGISTGPHIEFGVWPLGPMGSGTRAEALLRYLMGGGATVAGAGGGGAAGLGAGAGAPAWVDLKVPKVTGRGALTVAVRAGMQKITTAANQYGQKITNQMGGGVGSVGSAGIHSGTWFQVATQIAKRHGWDASQVQDWYRLEQHEDGSLSLTATNPSTGAYGLAQMYAGLGYNIAANKAKYAQYGGNANTMVGQLTGMANYIAKTYGSPSAAWAQYFSHPGGVGSYAQGGLVPGFAKGGFLKSKPVYRVTASQESSGGVGYRGNPIQPVGYSELSIPPSSLNFHGLGGLPYRTPLRIASRSGKQVVANKQDVGAGSSFLPVMGLYPSTSSDLGLGGGQFTVDIQSGGASLHPMRGVLEHNPFGGWLKGSTTKTRTPSTYGFGSPHSRSVAAAGGKREIRKVGPQGILGEGGPLPFNTIVDLPTINYLIDEVLSFDNQDPQGISVTPGPMGDAATISNLITTDQNLWSSTLYPPSVPGASDTFGSYADPSAFVLTTDAAGDTVAPYVSPHAAQVAKELAQIIGFYQIWVSDQREALALSDRVKVDIAKAIMRRVAQIQKVRARVKANLAKIKNLQAKIKAEQGGTKPDSKQIKLWNSQIGKLQAEINAEVAKHSGNKYNVHNAEYEIHYWNQRIQQDQQDIQQEKGYRHPNQTVISHDQKDITHGQQVISGWQADLKKWSKNDPTVTALQDQIARIRGEIAAEEQTERGKAATAKIEQWQDEIGKLEGQNLIMGGNKTSLGNTREIGSLLLELGTKDVGSGTFGSGVTSVLGLGTTASGGLYALLDAVAGWVTTLNTPLGGASGIGAVNLLLQEALLAQSDFLPGIATALKTAQTQAAAADTSALDSLYQQQIQLLGEGYAVSQAQYSVLSNLPTQPLYGSRGGLFPVADRIPIPYGGAFDEGGTIPGAVGQPVMILAHGGEEVKKSNQNTSSDGNVFHLVVQDGAVDASRIKLIANGEVQSFTRGSSRLARRQLPSNGGGQFYG